MDNNDELIIKLIIKIDEIKEAELDSLDEVDISYILSFSNFLNTEFPVVNLSESLLNKISLINTDIFTNESYLYDFYKNNPSRKCIAKYKNSNKGSNIKLIFNKNLVMKYIKASYTLIEYVDLKKEDICDYIKLNEKVLYLLEENFIDKEILLEALKVNDKVSLVLDEEDKVNYFPIRKYYLKDKKKWFLEDKEIYEKYIDSIINLLKKDCSLYIKLSKTAKCDIRVRETVFKIDKRYLSFDD